jgi:hypothetical protein
MTDFINSKPVPLISAAGLAKILSDGAGIPSLAAKLLFLVACLPWGACADAQQGSRASTSVGIEGNGKGHSEGEILKMLHKPRTPEELLKNVKIIADRKLLLDSAFYSPKVLRTCFAGMKARPTNLDHPTFAVDVDRRLFPGVSIEVTQGLEKSLGSGGLVQIHLNDDERFVVDIARRVFGSALSEERDLGIGTDGYQGLPQAKGRMTYSLEKNAQRVRGVAMGVQSAISTDRSSVHPIKKNDPIFDGKDQLVSIGIWEEDR